MQAIGNVIVLEVVTDLMIGIISGTIVSVAIWILARIRKTKRRRSQIRLIRDTIIRFRDLIFQEHAQVDVRLMFFAGLLNELRVVLDRHCTDITYEEYANLHRLLTTRLTEGRTKLERVFIFFEQIVEDETDPLSFLKIPKWQRTDRQALLGL